MFGNNGKWKTKNKPWDPPALVSPASGLFSNKPKTAKEEFPRHCRADYPRNNLVTEMKLCDLKHFNLTESREWSALRLTEQALGTRTCHICKGHIKKGEKHLATYDKPNTNRWWPLRSNICVFCLEELIRDMKVSMKGKIRLRKRERMTRMIILELDEIPKYIDDWPF